MSEQLLILESNLAGTRQRLREVSAELESAQDELDQARASLALAVEELARTRADLALSRADGEHLRKIIARQRPSRPDREGIVDESPKAPRPESSDK